LKDEKAGGYVAHMGDEHTIIFGKPTKRDYTRNLGLVWRVVFKWILKQNVRLVTGFKLLRMWSSGGLL
jgi:hypothetical protein